MNIVIISGNLGNDPEIRATATGTEFCKFTVAVSERYKDKGGEWKDKTEWVRCTSWGNINFLRALTKGTKVVVEGALASSSWQDKEGNKRTETFVNVRSVEAPRAAGGDARPHDEGGGEDEQEQGGGYGGGYAGRGGGQGAGYQGQGRAPGGRGGNAYSKPAPKAAPQQRRATPPPPQEEEYEQGGGSGNDDEWGA